MCVLIGGPQGKGSVEGRWGLWRAKEKKRGEAGERWVGCAPQGSCDNPRFKKILVSVKFLSAILGPEMGASILWTPGKMRSFCRKNHIHKIPRFRGGGIWVFFWGGVSILFLWACGFF